ncbi:MULTISPECIES: mannose-6-phosphate isomerase, class I [unclassified Archaeoglobus]|jgi:mannose-6-phosphate isomerase|uniref:mannose-6-phosphate isomerase, class I n=1 Tax=unclassified Archaeoglobus TaxID=2643606 RepID=UPI0025C4C384|nr:MULTISPECIES: mannose-6-phosphate isomerase, class I [unclassified Archaeoglobus]
MELPSFVFQAQENLVERPWGGEWIAMLKGFRQSGIGESWEFSAHPSNPSFVLVNGQQMSMPEFFAKFKDELLGKAAEKYSTFPLLVRIADVAGSSPVHVHPSDKTAESLGEAEGGVEAIWMVFNKGNAYIGFKDDVKLEELEEKFEGEEEFDFRELLNKFETTPYDTFVINPGIPHAAENLRLLETSSNSTLTYLFKKEDFEKVKKVLKTNKVEDYEVKGQKGKAETENFGVEVIDVTGTAEIRTDGVMNIIYAAEGYFLLKGKESVDLHRGYSCLVPASTESFSVESERGKIVRIYLKV